MDKLTPQLNDTQLRQNIDALLKGGKPQADVQKYVDNYSKSNDGNYVLKQPEQKASSSDYTPEGFGKGIAGLVKSTNDLFSPIVKSVGNALTSSERAFGSDIAAGATAVLPKSVTGQDNLDSSNSSRQEVLNSAIKSLKEVQQSGGDTKNILDLISKTTGQPVTSIEDLYPALKKSNLQVLGDAGGVLLDVLSSGSYGTAAKGAKTGKLLTAADKAIEATKATEGVVQAANVADKTLRGTLKTIGVDTAKRATVGAGTGYAYDVTQNLKDGATGSDIASPGMGTLLGGAIPTVIGGVQAGVAIGKDTAPRFINSLIKPKQADFSYGKDPGRTVSEMGITGNSIEDFTDNLSTARKDIGTKLGDIYESPANANIKINASDEIAKIDKAIAKAAKGGKENQGIVTALQNTKDALLYEHGVNADGVIEKMGTTPRNLSTLSPQEAFDLKKVIAEQTKFTGKPSDDKAVNAVLKDMYGGLKEKLNTELSVNNPEITKLNQQYADLTSAELATRNRSSILARSNLISSPIKTGGAAAAGVLAALASGGSALPVVLTGLGAAGLEKALESTAVKTRIAKLLGSTAPEVINQIPPEIRTALYRALPKFSSQLGQK